jgi:hypothetical protein
MITFNGYQTGYAGFFFRDRRDNVSGDRLQFTQRNLQLGSLGQDHGPFHDVFELSDISGPVILS